MLTDRHDLSQKVGNRFHFLLDAKSLRKQVEEGVKMLKNRDDMIASSRPVLRRYSILDPTFFSASIYRTY